MASPLLQVENLAVEFKTDDGIVKAVSGVSFDIEPAETVGIVGESGSGKSVTNLAVMGLVPRPPGRVTSGRAIYGGRDLLKLKRRELADIRGNRIAMIFQDPMTSLNPYLTVADQLTEVTMRHLKHDRATALNHAIEMLEKVGIPAASRRIGNFPHQFSGGMRQRVMIAMALSCKPDLLIADEPTTALDVTIQAQILDLMNELQQQEGTAIILITHDMGIVASICHRVNVMYAGRFVEEAEVDNLFADSRHPYTVGLLESIPRITEVGGERLSPINGQPPDLAHLPKGCAFAPRCPFKIDQCSREVPQLKLAETGSKFACFVDVATAKRAEVDRV